MEKARNLINDMKKVLILLALSILTPALGAQNIHLGDGPIYVAIEAYPTPFSYDIDSDNDRYIAVYADTYTAFYYIDIDDIIYKTILVPKSTEYSIEIKKGLIDRGELFLKEDVGDTWYLLYGDNEVITVTTFTFEGVISYAFE